jgi:hypothetical protein
MSLMSRPRGDSLHDGGSRRPDLAAFAIPFALNYQAIAIVFNLVQPIRPGRNLGVGIQGSKADVRMGQR